MAYTAMPAGSGLVALPQCRTTSTDAANATNELWARYLSARSTADRTRLTEVYLSLVGFVVSQLKQLPRHVERDKLMQPGVLGLIDAIERYDPERQVRFETFAVPRIRGSILDAVRAADWAPRTVRVRQRAFEDAVARLEARLKRAPTNEEVRHELGLSPAAFRALAADVSRREVHELDDRVEALAGFSEDPADAFERAEQSRMVRASLASLPERERQVLVMYYVDDLTLKEIGALLGVSESWVCKLHAKAMRSVVQQLRRAG